MASLFLDQAKIGNFNVVVDQKEILRLDVEVLQLVLRILVSLSALYKYYLRYT